MIVSPTGWLVVLNGNRAEPVISWNEKGEPVYVDHKLGRAVSAAEVTGKYHLENTEYPIVATLPAGGWRAQFADDADGGTPPEPLIGWAVTAEGNALPILRMEGDHGEPFTAGDYEDNSMELLPPVEAPRESGPEGFATPFNMCLPDGRILHGVEYPSGRTVVDHPGGDFTCEAKTLEAMLDAHPGAKLRRP